MEGQENKNLKRSPVVVVVGHVDHGKTSLLDYIRKTNVVAKEAGAITQSIGAYEITHNGQRITFIDTPGHEAFSKMRERGAEVADVAILVVAADEGVQPQTKEAIQILQNTKTPFVVAITKIDKNNADVERAKKELLISQVFLEGLGGDVSYQGVSSKTGEGINELLDLILLAVELQDLKYNLDAKAWGFILESKLDPRRGITASVILKDGVLRAGDVIATPAAKGKVRVLENFLGQKAAELAPSSPAVILGFENLPQVGEKFLAGKLSAADLTEIKKGAAVKKFTGAGGAKDEFTIRLILKADVAGSLEALGGLIHKIPLKPGQKLEVISQSVGEITDGDVKDAVATQSLILGFNVQPNKAAENLARAQNITILTSDVIYKLMEEAEKTFTASAEKTIGGGLEILAVFSARGSKQTIGGKVTKGKIKNKAVVDILRGGEKMGAGRILNLQQKKADVNVVNAGNECGLIFESNVKVEIGDKLIAS